MIEVNFTEEQEKAWDNYCKLNPQMLSIADRVRQTYGILMDKGLKELFAYAWKHGRDE